LVVIGKGKASEPLFRKQYRAPIRFGKALREGKEKKREDTCLPADKGIARSWVPRLLLL